MKKILLSSVAILMAATAAHADDNYPKAGDWLLRGRALGVVPQESSNLNIGGSVKVDNSVVPEFDLSYFFTPNVAMEVIAAVTKHDVRTASGTNVGNAWLLPPTLTLQYHFTNFNSFKPYVGAGVNYTHFFNEEGGALGHVDYKDSFGGALQAGVDVPLSERWYANLDVKKVFIHTTAKFDSAGVRANVDIDPLLVGVGVGYRF